MREKVAHKRTHPDRLDKPLSLLMRGAMRGLQMRHVLVPRLGEANAIGRLA
jgi:hypothetical protein